MVGAREQMGQQIWVMAGEAGWYPERPIVTIWSRTMHPDGDLWTGTAPPDDLQRLHVTCSCPLSVGGLLHPQTTGTVAVDVVPRRYYCTGTTVLPMVLQTRRPSPEPEQLQLTASLPPTTTSHHHAHPPHR